MRATWETTCGRCGYRLVDHGIYLNEEDIPDEAVEGEFEGVTGFYCQEAG
jgi:hypothetical protein